jgi:hypothetical protein
MTEKAPSERSFGVSVGAVCLVLAAWRFWEQAETAGIILASIGLVLVVLGVVAPDLLHGPNRVWWRIAQVLGWINSRLILGAFFVVILTPVGIVMRAFGRNPLRARRGMTNWIAYPTRIADAHHYERLF